ncbi:MAG TPA: zf-HC2 domain-containing protein [Longimicrobiaceae bacterium]|nr:zf-HC2 domain-containing protein [Longimicrobiaceae bacterium]
MSDPRNGPERPEPLPEVDAERLAALLDGRLGERERAEVLAHLAASDDDFGAFVDALEVTRELEAEDAAAPADGSGGDGGVTPLRPRTARRWWGRPGGHWLALAAGIVGVALLPVLWMQTRGPEVDDPGRFAALLHDRGAGLPAGWDRSPWGTTRGPGDPLTPEARAVRVGARLTELEVAVSAGDPRVPQIAAEIAMLVQEVPAGSAVAALYREIGESTGEQQVGSRLERGRTAAATLLGEEMVRLGAWLEAARVAAVRQDRDFFRARESAAILDRAGGMPAPGAPAREVIGRIRAAVGAPGSPDWGSLERDAAELLRVLGS